MSGVDGRGVVAQPPWLAVWPGLGLGGLLGAVLSFGVGGPFVFQDGPVGSAWGGAGTWATWVLAGCCQAAQTRARRLLQGGCWELEVDTGDAAPPLRPSREITWGLCLAISLVLLLCSLVP